MKVFDWEKLLKEQRIPFIESGPNVKRGEMAIQCPWCGSADPSKHLGISRESGWYSCWRNRAQHSGKSPLRLIMKLLRVPYGVARDIAGLGDDYVDPEGFDAMAAKLMNRDKTDGRQQETQRRKLRLDESFQIIEPTGRTRRHYEYLVNQRGFARPGDVERLGTCYGICAGVTGDFKDRIILPYYQDDELVTWTGRALGPSTMRYRDLSIDESIMAPKQTLFNHDCMLRPGRVLLLQEGPFDALKVDFYGSRHGVRSVALSTNSIKQDQAYLMQAAVTNFQRVLVMLDNADVLGITDSMRMQQDLNFLPGIGAVAVPFGAKDGAELTAFEIEQWALSL